VTLATIKKDPVLLEVALIKQSRLSVMPVTEIEFLRIVALGGKDF
jgi:predicted RNA-binding protein with PUA-like domain